MPTHLPSRRAAGRARLDVTVTTPDGPLSSSRGLGAWLAAAAPARARGDVTIAIVSDGRMRTLNRTFRGKDAVTDVLSFPVEPDAPARGRSPRRAGQGLAPANPPGRYLGDIVIAGRVARSQAAEAGHSITTELRVLALHGLLHLLGYDHEQDAGEMARAEARLRKKAGLAEGLIARRAR